MRVPPVCGHGQGAWPALTRPLFPCTEHIQSELVSRLYKEEIFTDLLRESSDVAERRKECTEMKLILEKALRIVNEVRDLSLR